MEPFSSVVQQNDGTVETQMCEERRSLLRNPGHERNTKRSEAVFSRTEDLKDFDRTASS